MKVLLINPPYHEVYSKVSAGEGCSPPLGLAYIASYLRHCGHNVSLVDANAEHISLDRFSEIVRDGFEVVGTTSFTPSVDNSARMLKMAKKIVPTIRTVMGGVHMSAAAKETMHRYPEVDYGVVGEGEVIVQELIECIEYDRVLKGVRGVVYRRNGEVVENERRPPIGRLDDIPYPAYDLLPMERYTLPIHHVGFGKKIPSGPFSLLFTSRGCPMNCSFCASKTVWGQKVRYRSASNVLDEIEMLHRVHGVKVFDIADDIFTINKKRLHEILDGIIDRKLDIHFNCLSRVDTIKPEDLEKLKAAGCYLIRYGVESGSQKILDRMHKNATPLQALQAFEMTNRCGIACTAGFIFGHPGETHKTIRETIDLAKKLDANLYHFFTAVPYPGTELYTIAREKGLLSDDAGWECWTQYPEKGVLKTETLSIEDLRNYRRRAIREVYFRPRYLWKCLRKIKTMDQAWFYLKGFLAVFSLMKLKRASRVVAQS